jgi:hypothetical protein
MNPIEQKLQNITTKLRYKQYHIEEFSITFNWGCTIFINSMVSEPNSCVITKCWQCLMNLPSEFTTNVVNVMLQLKKLGKDDPRRVIHSLKVALAITLVSTFYYFKPLYDSFGSSAMWAVITVIVVSEFSVGKLCFFSFPLGF